MDKDKELDYKEFLERVIRSFDGEIFNLQHNGF